MKIIDRFKDNIELNEDVSYIVSIEIHNIPINIYLSDYGQTYFFTFIDHNEIKSDTCGAYNTNYLESICGRIDYKGFMISLFGQDYWDDITHELVDRWTKKDWKESNPDGFKEMLENRNRTDYELYNIEEMYKMLEER